MSLKKRNFSRSSRRGPLTAPRIVTLSLCTVMSVVGVVTYLHFSSDSSDAATVGGPNGFVSQASQVMVSVLVPNANVPAGVALESRMFHQESKPEEFFGPDFVRSFDEIKGMYTKGLLLAKHPIVRDLLTTAKPVSLLTQSITSGHRAIAISVDENSSVGGFALPGSRVDVNWLTSFTGRKMVATIASDVSVLSANRQAQRSLQTDGVYPVEDPSTVTLLLPQKEAMRVRLAALHGRISLVLRGRNESGGLGVGQVPVDERGFHKVPEPVEKKPERTTTVKVTERGSGEGEILTFDERGGLVSH